MKVTPTKIPDVLLIEPQVFRDERGYFLETFQERRYAEAGIGLEFVQDNRSRSGRGTLRGLHLQRLHPQGKLVQVTEGEVFDVAVDLRPGSPTFKSWVGVHLSADNFRQFWVPPGLAHGFCVLSEIAVFEYKCTDYYDPADELTVAWNDRELGITWPITDPLLKPKDRQAPPLAQVLAQLAQR